MIGWETSFQEVDNMWTSLEHIKRKFGRKSEIPRKLSWDHTIQNEEVAEVADEVSSWPGWIITVVCHTWKKPW